ncbi:MAG: diphthine synthase [Candidatus Pacearchaeota archaeon]|jgi:diphthine synthase
MLYLIGLGLNERGISKEGLLAVEKCKKVYLEGYTVDFPYPLEELKFSKKIEYLDRNDVESNRLIRESKSIPVALLVYGCPLFATTHISLISDAEKQGVRTKVIYSASVFDAVAETGLQLYKFGKISSMPTWRNNYEPASFLDFVEQNLSIKAHSLILVDIGLHFKKALVQLEMAAQSKNITLNKIVVCSNLGTENSRIFYATPEVLRRKDIDAPFCFIIPSEMHFLEKEVLEGFG